MDRVTVPTARRAIRRKKPRPRPPDWIERQAIRTLVAEAAKSGIELTRDQGVEAGRAIGEVVT